MRSVTDQRQAFGYIAFGMTLAQRHAKPWIGLQYSAKTAFEGAFELRAEISIVELHQALGLLRGGRPDNRAPILLAIADQRQEGQRPVVGKALPGGRLMRFGAAHAGDNGVVQVVPLAGLAAGQAPHRRVRAVSGDDQRCAQRAAIGEGQQPLVTGTAHLFQARVGQ
ncbi:hypothetical protein D3C78_567690 [compost metagenome]